MRKVKWGILGTAGIAKSCTIPGMLKARNCELYAIAGRNPEKVKDYQETFGIGKGYGSYEELLQDPEVEAVYIPLPNTLHCEWTMKAMEAGKHVLCEKPLAPSKAQAAELFEAAEKNGVILMEAYANLHSPLVHAIKEEVDNGAIGEILYMESAFITSELEQNNIRMRKETLGGCVYDLGCYNTSQILWMFGEEPENVQAVSDFSEQGVDVYTTGILTFSQGRRAAFNCGMTLKTDAGKRIDRFQMHGTQGWIRSDARFNQEGSLSYTICTEAGETVKTVDVPDNYSLEVEQLGRCITDGERPLVSREFTLRNARTLDQILDAIGYCEK